MAPFTQRTRRICAGLGLSGLALSPLCCGPSDETSAASAARPTSTNISTPSTSASASTPLAAPVKNVSYEDKKDGFKCEYPSDWKPRSDPDYVLRLVPANGAPSRSITLDVPDLPPHLPGMIKLNLIENGYVGDWRKKHADLKVEESADRAVPGAKARFVRLTWKEDGRVHSDLGLLMMHEDRVYIISADADAADLAATRDAFDKVTASIQWEKKK